MCLCLHGGWEMNRGVKMPASHKWAIVVYVLVLGVNGEDAFRTREMPFVETTVLMFLCTMQMAGLFLWHRTILHYYTGAVALLMFGFRAMYYSVIVHWREVYNRETGVDWNSPSLLPVSASLAVVWLIAWLFYAYTFGRPSLE